MLVVAVVLCIISCLSIEQPQCINSGMPILTRTKDQPYKLEYKCLCPIDYIGNNCENHRKIFCETNSQPADHNRRQNTANLSFTMICYLEQYQYSNNSYRSFSDTEYQQLPLIPNQAYLDYKSNNYFIDPDYQIIWANNTNLFNRTNNQLKRSQNDTRTDQQILSQYPQYQFKYGSQFLGMPLLNSNFLYNLSVVRFMDKWVDKGLQNVQMLPVIAVNNTLAVKQQVTFETQIDFSLAEYDLLRMEMKVIEIYGKFQIPHTVALNNPVWLINNPDATKGDYLAGSSTISSKVWMILITVLVVITIILLRYLFRYYKQSKKKKMLAELEQQLSNQR